MTREYETGTRSLITFVWTDSTSTLQVSARIGSFPNMLQTRTLQLVCASGKGGVEPLTPDKSITYDGQAVSATLTGCK